LKEEEGKYIVVATTRPETILGDTAVCVKPNDPRFEFLKGKKVLVPIINRAVPIIMDDYVDMEFGTGCLKVTPAHDVNDYMLGEKYNLQTIDIFNDNGTLNQHGEMYAGMDRFDVREKIEKDLLAAGLMEKVEDYDNKVGYSERTDVPIEPKLSMQWFLKMTDLAKPALDAVMNDDIKLHPAKFKNTYRHWMENVKDWCISRQLWWGHRIPAYFLPEGGYVVASNCGRSAETGQGKNRKPIAYGRRPASGFRLPRHLVLFLVMAYVGIRQCDGQKQRRAELLLPHQRPGNRSGYLFFWVARMIIAGYEYKGDMPFRNVYLTGIVRDKLGRKMSKSLGNSPDPITLMEQYGADGVRMGLMMAAPAGNDVLFDDSLCEQGRNFNNKIWNAFRLVKGWTVDETIEQPEASATAIRWFQMQLAKTIAEVDDSFSKYRLSEAMMAVYKLFWDEFSSWYLELVKPGYQQPIDKQTYNATLGFFDDLLKLLHPFMPFITEELWQATNNRNDGESIMMQQMPQLAQVDNNFLGAFEIVKEIIAGVRSVRLQKNIPNKDALTLEIVGEHDDSFNAVITKMCNLTQITRVAEKTAGAGSFLVRTTEYAVPLGSLLNVEEELAKLNEELVYLQGFRESVLKKLSNESFVGKAPAKVIEMERKKLADAESKINSLQESIAALK
jgi:valyl-tRNA synthetase